jgi:hypothetical protein
LHKPVDPARGRADLLHRPPVHLEVADGRAVGKHIRFFADDDLVDQA